MAKITLTYTTDAGETPAFPAFATGATLAKITTACTTDAGDGNFLRGRVNAAQPGNRRRVRSAAW